MKQARRMASGTTSLSRRAEIIACITRIPRGMVSTYGAVAKAAGLGRGARQVASLLRRSGHGLPWHRVLGAGGQIKLQGNAAFEQRFRLEAEGVKFRGKRVNMAQHEFEFARKSARHVR